MFLLFNPFPHNNTFWRVWERSLLKTLWEKEKMLVASIFSFSHNVFYTIKEKEKMLVASIFSFSHNVFYTIKDRNFHLCYIYFVVCKCFEFRQGQIFVIWEWVKYELVFLSSWVGHVRIELFHSIVVYCSMNHFVSYEVQWINHSGCCPDGLFILPHNSQLWYIQQ